MTETVTDSADALRADESAIDLDALNDEALTMPDHPASKLTLDMLDQVARSARSMPPSFEVTSLGDKEYAYLIPGMSRPLRITTDPEFFEEHSDSLELWSPGSPLFPNASDWAGPDKVIEFPLAANNT